MFNMPKGVKEVQDSEEPELEEQTTVLDLDAIFVVSSSTSQ